MKITPLSLVCWALAIIVAATLDAQCARFIRASGLDRFVDTNDPLKAVLKAPGAFRFTILLAVIVACTHLAKWRGGVFVLLSAAAVSLVNSAVKWIIGRYRPFKPMDGSGRLTPFEFHPLPNDSTNLCFPSGHACLAFATAAALGILWPRWRAAFYAGAILVAFDRVAENAHWLSDTVAAAALAIGGAFVIRELNDRFALLIPRDSLLQRAGECARAPVAS